MIWMCWKGMRRKACTHRQCIYDNDNMFFLVSTRTRSNRKRNWSGLSHAGKFHSQSLLLLDLSVPDQIVRAAKQWMVGSILYWDSALNACSIFKLQVGTLVLYPVSLLNQDTNSKVLEDIWRLAALIASHCIASVLLRRFRCWRIPFTSQLGHAEVAELLPQEKNHR